MKKCLTQGKEFMDKYSDFVDHSFDDQITHLCRFGDRGLRTFRENDYNQNNIRRSGLALTIMSSFFMMIQSLKIKLWNC